MLKKLYFNVFDFFDYDFTFFVKIYIDVFLYKKNIYICQLQNEKMKSLLYDSMIFNSTQKKYHIYKRKLYAMMHFTIKYRYMFFAKNVFIVYINHKLLINFMNVIKHENIYVKWANKFRNFNMKIDYVENKKNLITNDLFKIIFNQIDCFSNQFVKKFYF